MAQQNEGQRRRVDGNISLSLDGRVNGRSHRRWASPVRRYQRMGRKPPIGRDVPFFVVTHSAPTEWAPKYDDTSFTFITDGLESAIEQAKAVAGDNAVDIGPGSIVGQALESGLVDEIKVDLVPVLIGGGVRFLESLATAPVTLDTPRVIEGDRVTHLIYKVRAAS